MERKISVFILFVLLAVTFKIRLMTNANGLNNSNSPLIRNEAELSDGSSTGSVEHQMNNENWATGNGSVSYDEIKRYVDTRNGSFKSASYIPNSVLIRKYDNGQTAVKNSLIDITYQTPRGEYHREVRKIDVFVKNGKNWVKTERDPLRSTSVAAL